MSAAAGISAAKKRRGVGSDISQSGSIQQKQQMQGQQMQGQQMQGQQMQGQQMQGQQQPGMVTPIQILQNHELRLKHIEKQLNDAEQYATNMTKYDDSTLKNEVSVVSVASSQCNDSDLLKSYKSKCDTLEKKVEELTQLIQKVQTFSMETNLALLKVKRSIDEDFEKRIQELKKSYVNTDNMMLENVKQDTASALSSLSAVSSLSQSLSLSSGYLLNSELSADE
jgi:hypothetical protein